MTIETDYEKVVKDLTEFFRRDDFQCVSTIGTIQIAKVFMDSLEKNTKEIHPNGIVKRSGSDFKKAVSINHPVDMESPGYVKKPKKEGTFEKLWRDLYAGHGGAVDMPNTLGDLMRRMAKGKSSKEDELFEKMWKELYDKGCNHVHIHDTLGHVMILIERENLTTEKIYAMFREDKRTFHSDSFPQAVINEAFNKIINKVPEKVASLNYKPGDWVRYDTLLKVVGPYKLDPDYVTVEDPNNPGPRLFLKSLLEPVGDHKIDRIGDFKIGSRVEHKNALDSGTIDSFCIGGDGRMWLTVSIDSDHTRHCSDPIENWKLVR